MSPATAEGGPSSAGWAAPVALVTGGARGVGAAVARALAARGYAVAVHCHASLAEARRLAAELQAAGRPALAVTANLREEGAVRAMVHRVADHFGRVDVVAACARRRRPGSLEETSVADLLAAHEVNVAGTFVVLQEAAAIMLRQAGGGRLVTLAEVPAAGQSPAFAASQGALAALTAALAAELGRGGPRVTARCVTVAVGAAEDDVAAAVLEAAAG